MYRFFFKGLLDFIVALFGLVILSPIFLIVTIVLLFSNKGVPFFIQPRPGKDGKVFSIIKFKTMNDKKSENGHLLSDYERLTNAGKFVRKTSLDEIPQLINVLKGDMSIVGPRPLLTQYLPLYNDFQNKRHQVKPGITGWAQVNGRNALSWDEKFALDAFYVEHLTFLLDCKIVLITLQKIWQTNGVNANNFITMEAFKGNQS